MAADFMAVAVQGDDVLGVDRRPVGGDRGADQTARNVEGSPRVMRFENPGAGSGGAFRNVVEGETDHGGRIGQAKLVDAQMHRQPMIDFHSRV